MLRLKLFEVLQTVGEKADKRGFKMYVIFTLPANIREFGVAPTSLRMAPSS